LWHSDAVQGVVKGYDPGTGVGSVVRDTDRAELDLAPDALAGSVFRMLRQGQRVVFDVDGQGLVTHVRLGSEADMSSPETAPPDVPIARP
jgi:CspA family cold shock protein